MAGEELYLPYGSRKEAWERALRDATDQNRLFLDRKQAWEEALQREAQKGTTKTSASPHDRKPRKSWYTSLDERVGGWLPFGAPARMPTAREMEQMNINPEFAAKHPTFTRAMLALTAPLHAIGQTPVGKFMHRMAEAENEVRFATPSPTHTRLGSRLAEVAADLLGGALGFVGAGPGAPSAGGELWGLGTKAVNRVLPASVHPALRTAAEMAAGSAAYEAGTSALNDRSPSAKDMLKAVAENALLGALSHGAGRVASRLFGEEKGAALPAEEPPRAEPGPTLEPDFTAEPGGAVHIGRPKAALPEGEVQQPAALPGVKSLPPAREFTPDFTAGPEGVEVGVTRPRLAGAAGT
ncbi:MAG: hypothetical protein ACPLUI_14720, partial [Desulfofundulus sp.]